MIANLPVILLTTLAQVEAPDPPGLQHLASSSRPHWTPLESFYDPSVQVQAYPSFGVDDEGTRHVVYAGRDFGCHDTICGLFYQMSTDGRTWTPAVKIPGSEDFGGGPQVAGARGGRAYIAWFGVGGLKVTWTDDRGASFAPAVLCDPSLPGELEFSMDIDASGALHFAWMDGSKTSLYYLRSTPTYLPTASGMTFRDPLFLPGQHLFAEDGRVYHHPVVAIDALGFVSIVYEDKDRHIAFTRAYQGLLFPPSRDLGEGNYVQMTVAPDGPVTILFSHDNAAHTEFYLYSLVSFDGINFEGPFKQTKGNAGLELRRSVRSGPDGAIYAIWFQKWPGKGSDLHATYAQSADYGLTFPRRDLVHDQRIYPSVDQPILALTPDNIRCVVTHALQYTQSRQ